MSSGSYGHCKFSATDPSISNLISNLSYNGIVKEDWETLRIDNDEFTVSGFTKTEEIAQRRITAKLL
jgi:hypothetical protein